MRLIYFDQLDNFYNWQYIVGRKKDEIRKSQGHTKVAIIHSKKKVHLFVFLDLKTIHQLISKSLRLSSSVPNILHIKCMVSILKK